MTPRTRPHGTFGFRDGDIEAVLPEDSDAVVPQGTTSPDGPDGSTLEEVPDALEDDEEERQGGRHAAGEDGRRRGARS